MSVETDFVNALKAHAPLVALVVDRIAANAMDAKADLPFVVYTVAHDTQPTLVDNGITTATFTAECWGKTAADADNVADKVAAAVAVKEAATASLCAWVTNRSKAYDPEVALDGCVLTIDWIQQ